MATERAVATLRAMTRDTRARRIDERTVAILALFLSIVAIALEIAYTVGNFALATFGRLA